MPIIAPGTIASFDKFAIGENVVAGNAMARRAQYAFGGLLEPRPARIRHRAASVIGSTRNPTVSYLSPTDGITHHGREADARRVEFEFLYAPDTEAPEEMHIWIPQLKALTCAENANHSLHNIQTLRGARTRDSRNFARYLDETLERWGDEAEVHYGPHTWPVWGNDEVVVHRSRSATRTSTSTTRRCGSRTRGTRRSRRRRRSNSRASSTASGSTTATTARSTTTCGRCSRRSSACGTATRYRCTPTRPSNPRSATSTSSDATRCSPRVVARSKKRTTGGRCEILHKLVFADPDDTEARELQADAYEQLGYQAEGPQWRGIFLTAARELREGIQPTAFTTASEDTILGMPIDILFDFVAVHVDGVESGGRVDFRSEPRLHRQRRDVERLGRPRRTECAARSLAGCSADGACTEGRC